MYEYKACGLEGIFLKNGYLVEQTPYGETVSIVDLEGLHRAIAQDIVRQPRPMTGHQFRFLRKEQDMVQEEVAALFRVDVQTIANWEKRGKNEIPGPADIAMRAFYTTYLDMQFQRVAIAADAQPDEGATFSLENDRWIEEQAA
ncbi:hypothetical protein D3C78_1022810 [compost metagenome]